MFTCVMQVCVCVHVCVCDVYFYVYVTCLHVLCRFVCGMCLICMRYCKGEGGLKEQT